MLRRTGAFVFAMVCLAQVEAHAFKWESIDPVVIGGRFQYFTVVDRASVPFRWNTTTQSRRDLTRLMLDLDADTRYGDLYLKGSALWDLTRPSQIQKRFLFEQGDYLWSQDLNSIDYSLRLFANERRFITYDAVAPLLKDDLVGSGQDNLGVRFDTRIKNTVDVIGLYSSLGDANDGLRDIGYLRTAYRGPLILSASYLLDHPGGIIDSNHAIFKIEVSSSFKQAYGVVSYQRSGYSDRDVFFPSASEGEDAKSLPKDAAFFADLRLTSIRIPKAGSFKFIYNYAFVGESFFNDLGLAAEAQQTNSLTGLFRSTQSELNGRLSFRRSERFFFEEKDIDRWEGALWGRFRNGLDFWLRGETIDTTTPGFEDNGNFVDVALQRELSKVRTAIHVMWKDIDTIFSDKRFAWDGKLALSPNWGLYWRFLVSSQFDLGDMLYSRLEYRPNDRLFFVFGYGRTVIGDGPFLLEDQDIELSRFSSAQYTLLLRGDF